jgi:CheY-like chemotaxis protein/nitrogen-specific signal transduction histidine kinase
MAEKSRSRRLTGTLKIRSPKIRPPKIGSPRKRASGITARKSRKRAPKSASKSATKRATNTAGAGMVEAALAAFAHEVRTPLTGILAISDLLTTSDLGERERRWVDTIKAGAEHLASLATLFVDAARGGNAAAVRRDLFDLRSIARNAGGSLAGRAAAKSLQSRVEISDKLPALVIGDAVRLRAALENLIDNAVKFTEQGGVTLRVEPTRGAKDKLGVAFSISDSGIGLTLNEIKRLFRPFSQANFSIASRFGGAGLGLSSVKQIARAMGGDIVVRQRRGGGTTFTLNVTLTRAKAPEPPALDGHAGGLPAEPAPALRVLGVEDNPFGRVVLNTILTELGHQAEFIGRGETATERIAQGGFDAVLMDMVLPGIPGIETIRRIRQLKPPLGRIPIIGVSGRGEDEAASRAAGADAFLLKPVSPRALATALLEATRRAAGAT